MQCTITVANTGPDGLGTVNVRFARSASFGSAATAACTQTGADAQGQGLAAGATRKCTTTVALDPADITANSVTLRAGVSHTIQSTVYQGSQTSVTMKVAALRITAVPGTRAADGTIAMPITITNVVPVAVTSVTVQLPPNVTLGASSPCAAAIANIAVNGTGATVSCPATFTITPEVAEGPVNTLPITFTASSAILQAPAAGVVNVNLGRSALLTVTPSIIGNITKEGGSTQAGGGVVDIYIVLQSQLYSQCSCTLNALAVTAAKGLHPCWCPGRPLKACTPATQHCLLSETTWLALLQGSK